MYHEFHCLGDIDEVVIPSKRDKRGLLYTFVRFFNVKDDNFLATKLDNIFLYGRKLHENVPRFQRNTTHGFQQGLIIIEHQASAKMVNLLESSRPEKALRFANKRNTYVKVLSSKEKIFLKSSTPPISFNVEESDLKMFHKAYAGLVVKPESIYNIQEIFNMGFFFLVQLTPRGANMSLLEDRVKGALNELLSNDEQWLCHWFKEVCL